MVKSKAVPMGIGKNERVSRSRERLHSVVASRDGERAQPPKNCKMNTKPSNPCFFCVNSPKKREKNDDGTR